jgi:hypothetical protein
VRGRWVALATAVSLAISVSSSMAGSSASPGPRSAYDVRVRHTLFGAQDSSADSASLSRIHEGSIRFWKFGTRWDQVETSPGHYDWTRLDPLVAAATAAHAQITMTVAMTPSFYAAKPTDPPSTVAPYRRFVTALMTRYPEISAYQVWNEANISTFWTGSTRQLVELARVLARTRDRLRPDAQVIGPPMVTRLPYELKAIAPIYRYRLDGKPLWRYLDAVSLHLYPMPRYGHRIGVPEDSIRLLRAARGQLRTAGVPASMPIWNTEINYGLEAGPASGSVATPISDAAQAANVMRTYLLGAANGVARVFWYRYDLGHSGVPGTLGNTLLSTPGQPDELTPAGEAYVRAQRWMHGTLLGVGHRRPCARDPHGTYTCVVRDASGTRRIYWNPFGHARVHLADDAHHEESVLGVTSTVAPGSTIRVGPKPVLVSRTG